MVFVAAVATGVAFSGAIAWGHPILAAHWGLLWRLCLWAAAWIIAVAAALRLPRRTALALILGAIAEAWFSLVYRLGGIGARHKAWQIAGLSTDLATVALLSVALRRWGRDTRWVALYALSPFAVLEIVNNAHIDGLAIAFVVAALTVGAEGSVSCPGYRWTRSEAGRDIAVGLLLGAAALVKLYPALLLVAVVGLSTTRLARTLGRAAAAAGGLAMVAYLPHVWVAGWRVVGYLPGYLKEEHYDHGGRFLLAGTLGLPGPATTALAALGLLAAVGWVLWRRPSFPHGAAVLLAAVFLTATPVQSWYACSLLAVATLTSWPWWAAVTAAGYPYFFAVILDDPHSVGLGRACYAAALAALVIAYYIERRRAAVSTMTVSPNRAVMADVLH